MTIRDRRGQVGGLEIVSKQPYIYIYIYIDRQVVEMHLHARYDVYAGNMLFFFLILPFDEMGGGTISEQPLEFLDKALGAPEEEEPREQRRQEID